MSRHAGSMLLAAFALGCGEAGTGGAPAVVASGAQGTNGSSLNGSSLNGSSLNDADGALGWVHTSGARLGNRPVEITLDRGEIVAANARGEDVEGLVLSAVAADGSAVELVVRSAGAIAHDRWRYEVEDASGAGICPGSPGALVVPGRWDPQDGSFMEDDGAFTFACEETSSIAKCVDLGYVPWKGIGPHHRACVRLLRADYCGNGVSHTTDGKIVNVWDDIGVQHDAESWIPEAEWDENGARCIAPATNRGHELSCGDARVDSLCGQAPDFNGGTLVVSETPNAGV